MYAVYAAGVVCSLFR